MFKYIRIYINLSNKKIIKTEIFSDNFQKMFKNYFVILLIASLVLTAYCQQSLYS